MSQPFDRSCKIPEPGKPNEVLGEFWEESPWTISSSKNLSAYERNRVYMNHNGKNFFDISYITGADSDGDGRCAVAADLNNDGLNEIIVRQVGGGPLNIYENRFPLKNWLKVSLRGNESNSFGIGARLTALVNDVKLVREMYPVNSYRSQSPNIVHFGLNDSWSWISKVSVDFMFSLIFRFYLIRFQRISHEFFGFFVFQLTFCDTS